MAIVCLADTIVQPGAVMVKFGATSVAHGTVFGAFAHKNITNAAEKFKGTPRELINWHKFDL